MSKIKFELFVLDFWPNPGPGRLPLDLGRGDVELAGVFASVASVVVSFVSKCILWNIVNKKLPSKTGICGCSSHLRNGSYTRSIPFFNLNIARILVNSFVCVLVHERCE